MSELQTFLAVVVVIYVLCVIVQALQEVVKWALNTKAKTLESVIKDFMGQHLLTLDQVQDALKKRGLEITALEHFQKDDFRRLLDGIEFTAQQVQMIPGVVGQVNTAAGQVNAAVSQASAAVEQFKDHAAAAYDGFIAKFQQCYTSHNKRWVIGISFVVVLALNASIIKIYEILAVNQTMAQAIAGTAPTIANSGQQSQSGTAGQSQDAANIYSKNREAITNYLKQYPVLLRTSEYPDDLKNEAGLEVLGLVLMGALVSLGAPFWNDVLKGMMGVNNALNSGNQKTQ